MGVKKRKKKATAMDTTIIEHLACLEINNLILQPPFHLVSNIQWNDKGLAFDGEIDVFSHNELEKANFISKVLVQVKGTTTQKKIHRKDKIKHPVKKKDLEVYYKNGKGVLYFVVTINPKTYARQAYYRILAPLDLKNLLSMLDASGNNSISLTFKRLEKGYLESVCKTVIDVVKKQPQHYIEASEKTEFTHYELSFVDVKKDSFDLFEESAYVYGVLQNMEIPLKVAQVEEIRKVNSEIVLLNDEEFNISYEVSETGKKFNIVIEDTLIFEFDKITKAGKVNLGKVRTLESYIKCLQVMNYQLEHDKLPFQFVELKATWDRNERFQGIENDIKLYKELIEVCNQIGISEHYVFNEEEDLPSLFNGIIDIFKYNRYESLGIHEQEKMKTAMIYNIELSQYVKIKVIYIDNKFINFYSEEAMKKIGGVIPKKDIMKSRGTDNLIPDNWEEYYQRVSIYIAQNIEEMVEDTNFDFEIVKLSFNNEYHDIKADLTINASLDYITYYNESLDEKYLEFALNLNQRYSTEFPKNDIAKINIYLIKLKQHQVLSDIEKNDILDIQERAEINKDQRLRFASEVLLQNKIKALRIFNSLDEEEKELMREFPIYHFYENLK
ncbi:DUF4365 domain-containing protein [Bacillus thuringiensis serovar andalousiensis]|uniref:DUF4365 domain-containing protein n=1 Tax=Bacillus thuringiensis TaxID=1428 RepID=A0A9X6Q4W9_BACTU|nr:MULTISPECIES: DUF4365 domain-containing protein [Bacillus cereus group]MDA2614704.1 DUF4365 domain-containing protein [Bacillus cereus]MEB8821758.1 DUF4365 domain-containing protein [Bacillus cereus]MEB8975329.1 DUF4365 domain-containing protein [Bacillus cereus]MEB9135981.1 DUF4365 domain-containing protein [Bacillus cereus]MEB9509918.1 DUF4365 domain-containing protein [Bacillus cereus]